MKFKNAKILKSGNEYEVIKEFNNKLDFDTYCNKNNPDIMDISINNIGFYGWDEIDLFFQCRNLDEFFDLTEI